MLNLTNKRLLYILGFIWADGNLNSSIKIEIKYDDYFSLKHIFEKDELDWEFSERSRYLKQTDKYYKQGCFKLYNKEFYNELCDYDFKEKSILSPDKIIKDIPNELLHHFIRGYVDGDGSFSLYKHKRGFMQVKFNITSTINYDWWFIIEIFNKIGISNYLINEYTRKTGNSSIITLFTKYDIIKIGEWLYQDSVDNRLERKYNVFKDILNSNIKSIGKKEKEKESNTIFIKENYNKLGIKKCAELLNISNSTVYRVAVKYDLIKK